MLLFWVPRTLEASQTKRVRSASQSTKYHEAELPGSLYLRSWRGGDSQLAYVTPAAVSGGLGKERAVPYESLLEHSSVSHPEMSKRPGL